MISFWVICAVLVAIALSFFVFILIKKHSVLNESVDIQNQSIYEKRIQELERDLEYGLIDEEQFKRAQADIERTLIDDVSNISTPKITPKQNQRPTVVLVGLLIPIFSVLIYSYVNTGHHSLSGTITTQVPNNELANLAESPSLDEATAQLKETLAQDPNNLEGWLMLGKAYVIAQKYKEAADAFKKANELAHNRDPNILISYAEALALSKGQNLETLEIGLINQALAIDPNNERGLWYAGLYAFQHEQYTQAIEVWKKLEPIVPAERADIKQALDQVIRQAQEKAGIEVAQSTSDKEHQDAKQTSNVESKSEITVSVELARELQEKISSQDTLFIYARAMQGPKMPLALVHLTASSLPTRVVLDDTKSMTPDLKLSSAENVEVIARLSKSGEAAQKPGDLVGRATNVPTASPTIVYIVINEVSP